jgi:ABC-type transport system substrate-binding protein/class 3 adenylate cyclase
MPEEPRGVQASEAARPAAGPREERKVVTAVFADVVGSTALADRLDPEEVKLVMGEAVARVVTAIEALGGTIKDLAGDGVLALFGAPAAHEDDEERAVRASLQIVADLEDYASDVARGWGIEGFSVRVGVHTGPVVVGVLGAGERIEYAAFGDTVNAAARIQTAADPGSVLVSNETRRRTEPLFSWGEPTELELKGKAEHVTAYPVTGIRPAAARPRLLREQAPLVGREPELGSGSEVVGDVLRGGGSILFVTGEPGIGKSRLVAELRRVFEESPCEGGRALWIEGRCASYGESTPYGPFRDLVRNWLGVATGEAELRVRIALRRRIDQLFAERALEIYPYLGAMLGLALEPDAQSRLAELSPEALQYRSFEVVGALLARLTEDGPVAVSIEDLHWADPTSLQLVEQTFALVEQAPLLVVATARLERDDPFWPVKELAAREFPHRTRELVLEPLSGEADRELLTALVGEGTLPAELERRLLEAAEGNPFFLEELVGSFVDGGALVRADGGWRFDHEVPVEVPPTVERVIVARIDRLSPDSHDLLVAASVLGRQFSLPLLEGVSGDGAGLREQLLALQRLDLVREARRWPEPEYQFKHALIQEAAYRTVLTPRRTELHRKAAGWLEDHYAENEDEVLGLLAHHWLAAGDEAKAIAYLTRAGDRARQEYALDEAIDHYRALLPLLEERGARQEIALVLFKLALALHTALRFGEANSVYLRAFEHWTPPQAWPGTPSATLRMASSFLPDDLDPLTAIAWPNIQACMQLFDRLVEAWPERTIVPALAERWEIADDGLRYVFHLHEGLRWSDGEPLTAHDVEYGIKRVLDPDAPGSSVAIYFVLENGQDYYLRHNSDADRIGVRALDDLTVEFRLVAPAPYFMSVMNRPDAGPQPRHAIERHGDRWTEPELQVVSGPLRQVEREPGRLLLERREGAVPRRGNANRLEYVQSTVGDAVEPYEADELDMIAVRYTPRIADLIPQAGSDAKLGPAAWTGYLAFDHAHPALGNVDFRRALAHAVDRDALERLAPLNLVVATGGVVPPALQGHTPDIAPRFEPERAREHLDRSGLRETELAVAALDEWSPIVGAILEGWERVLGIRATVRSYSLAEAMTLRRPWDFAPVVAAGWLPGYPDPEYYLRLLLHSDAKTNEGGFAYEPFDALIERARHERRGRERLELFHEADRMAIADQVALIPIVYGRSTAFVKPWVDGWWEFGKTSSSFADLVVGASSPRS